MSQTDDKEPKEVTDPNFTFGESDGSANYSQKDYHHPAAAWGAALSVGEVLLKQNELVDGVKSIFKMNHDRTGFDCPGCAWQMTARVSRWTFARTV